MRLRKTMGNLKMTFAPVNNKTNIDLKMQDVSLNDLHDGVKSLIEVLAKEAETSVPFIIANLLQEMEPEFLSTVGGKSHPQAGLAELQQYDGKTEQELIDAGKIKVVRGKNSLVKDDDA